MVNRLGTLLPVFIVGTSKSGTSFLLSLFDSHPKCVTLFETAVYVFPKMSAHDRDKFLKLVDGFFTPRIQKLHVGHGITRDNFLAEVEQLISSDNFTATKKSMLYAFISVVLKSMDKALAGQITHFIEKTPTHHRYVDKIFEDFPNAKIVHVLRDPRDNYLSLKRRIRDPESSQYQNPDYHPIVFLRNELVASLNSAYENVSRYGNRYRIMFYEDMISHKKDLLLKLAAWLNLPWSESLLIPTIDGKLWQGNSTASDLKNQLKPFDTRTLGRWRNELTNKEVDLLEYMIESYKLQPKYPVSRNRTLINFVMDLSTPFQDELKLEKKRTNWATYSPKNLVGLVGRYIKRRLSILYHMKNHRMDADHCLTGEGESWF